MKLYELNLGRFFGKSPKQDLTMDEKRDILTKLKKASNILQNEVTGFGFSNTTGVINFLLKIFPNFIRSGSKNKKLFVKELHYFLQDNPNKEELLDTLSKDDKLFFTLDEFIKYAELAKNKGYDDGKLDNIRGVYILKTLLTNLREVIRGHNQNG